MPKPRKLNSRLSSGSPVILLFRGRARLMAATERSWWKFSKIFNLVHQIQSWSDPRQLQNEWYIMWTAGNRFIGASDRINWKRWQRKPSFFLWPPLQQLRKYYDLCHMFRKYHDLIPFLRVTGVLSHAKYFLNTRFIEIWIFSVQLLLLREVTTNIIMTVEILNLQIIAWVGVACTFFRNIFPE